MKKAIIFVLIMLPMVAFSQTAITGFYKAFATGTDTLTTGATKSYILDLGKTGAWGGRVYDLHFQTITDYISDSCSYTVKFYRSNDGTNWPQSAVDSSAAYSKVVEDIFYDKTFSAQTARFWKIALIGASQDQHSKVLGRVDVVKHW